MEPNDDRPPKRWWNTPFGRAMHDFEWLARPEVEGQFFRSIDTISNYVAERRGLAKRAEIFMVLSFIGAALVIAGGLPKDSQISVLGFEGPTSLISLQLLAALVAGLFSRYMQSLASLMLLSGMIEKLLGSIIPQGPEFVAARYDSTYLWANLLRRRHLGYQSPTGHVIINASSVIVGLLWLLLHIIVVATAMWVAVVSGYKTAGPQSFSFFVAMLASLMTGATLLVFIFGIVIPLPYPMSKEWVQELERQKAEKAKAVAAAETGQNQPPNLVASLLNPQSIAPAAEAGDHSD